MSGDGSDLLVASSPLGADGLGGVSRHRTQAPHITPEQLTITASAPKDSPPPAVQTSPLALPPPTVPTPELPPDSTTADSPTGEMNGIVGSKGGSIPPSSPNCSDAELPSSTAEPPPILPTPTPPPPPPPPPPPSSLRHIPESVILHFDDKKPPPPSPIVDVVTVSAPVPPTQNGSSSFRPQLKISSKRSSPRSVFSNLDQIVKKLTCVAAEPQNGDVDHKTDEIVNSERPQNIPLPPSSPSQPHLYSVVDKSTSVDNSNVIVVSAAPSPRVALDLSTKIRTEVDDNQVKSVKWGIMKGKNKERTDTRKKIVASTEQISPLHENLSPSSSLQVLRIPQFPSLPHQDTKMRSEIRVTGLTGGATVVAQISPTKLPPPPPPIVHDDKKPYDKRFEVRPTALVNPFPGGEPSSLRPPTSSKAEHVTTSTASTMTTATMTRPVQELAAALNGATPTVWALKALESSEKIDLEKRRVPVVSARGKGGGVKLARTRPATPQTPSSVVEFQKALAASAVRLQLPPPPQLPPPSNPPSFPAQPPPHPFQGVRGAAKRKRSLKNMLVQHIPSVTTKMPPAGQQTHPIQTSNLPVLNQILNSSLSNSESFSVSNVLGGSGGAVSITYVDNSRHAPVTDPDVVDRLKRLGTVIEVEEDPNAPKSSKEPNSQISALKMLEKMTFEPPQSPVVSALDDRPLYLNKDVSLFPKKKTVSTVHVSMKSPLSIIPIAMPPPPSSSHSVQPIPSKIVEQTPSKVQFLAPQQVSHFPPLTITKAPPKSDSPKTEYTPKVIPIPFVTVTKTTSSSIDKSDKPVEIPTPICQAVIIPQPTTPIATNHVLENCTGSEDSNSEQDLPLPLLEPVIVLDEEEQPLSSDRKFIFKHDSSLSVELPNDQKVFSCDICSAAFHHLHMLRKHYFRLHVARKYISEKDLEAYNIDPEKADDCNEEYLYRCHTCRQCLPTKAELKSHLTDHPPVADLSKHIKGSKDYKCERCNAHFKWRKIFGKHKKVCKAPLMTDKTESDVSKPMESASDDSPSKEEPITAVTELALRQVIDTRALRNSDRLARQNYNKQVKSKRKTRQSVALLVHSPPQHSSESKSELSATETLVPNGSVNVLNAVLTDLVEKVDKSCVAAIKEKATEPFCGDAMCEEKIKSLVCEIPSEPEKSSELEINEPPHKISVEKDVVVSDLQTNQNEQKSQCTSVPSRNEQPTNNKNEIQTFHSAEDIQQSSEVVVEATPGHNVQIDSDGVEATQEAHKVEESATLTNANVPKDPRSESDIPVLENDTVQTNVVPEVAASLPSEEPPALLDPPVSTSVLSMDKLDPKSLHNCLYCNETFSNGNKKRTHTLSFHPYVRKNHPCVFCKNAKESFSTNVALFNHLLSSHPNLYFGCSSCKERFLNLEELKNHYSLRRHEQDHVERNSLQSRISELNENEVTFTCGSCTRIFLFKQCFLGHKCNPEKDKQMNSEKPLRPSKLRKVRAVERSERNEKPIRVDPETMFYSQVSYNVRQNLTHFLDGKLPMEDDDEEVEDESESKVPERNMLSFSAGFPGSGLQLVPEPEPYSRVKAQWEKYNFPKNYDGRCGLTSYIKDMSYLDISTQMIMRRNLQRLQGGQEVVSPSTSEDVPSVLALERLATQCAESFGVNSAPGGEGDPLALGELSGEWVRDRVYVCSVCSWESPCLWTMEDHKYEIHPQVLCPQYELVGDQRALADTIYKRLLPAYAPPFHQDRPNLRSSPVTKIQCTKCRTDGFSTRYDLHVHILACAGEPIPHWAPTPKKRRWPPKKRRRPRRGLKRNIPSTPHRPIKVRTKPGDTDTIQKMIANLPAKRSTRRVIFDEADLKTRSQSTIQNVPVLLPSNRLVLPPSMSHHKHQKNNRNSPKCKELILSPPHIPKETDLIDTSAERGDVLSSLRMMPVSTPREELLEPRQIIDKVIIQKVLGGQIEDATSHQCNGCGQTSESKNALRKHQKGCLYFRQCGPNAEHKCKTCLRIFDNLVALIEHSCDEMPKLEIEKDIDPVDSADIPVLSPVPSEEPIKLEDDSSLKPSQICGISFVNGKISFETAESVEKQVEALSKQMDESNLQRTRSHSLGDIRTGKKVARSGHRRSARLGQSSNLDDSPNVNSEPLDSDFTYESAPETKQAILRQKSSKLPTRNERSKKSPFKCETADEVITLPLDIETDAHINSEPSAGDSLWETQTVIDDVDNQQEAPTPTTQKTTVKPAKKRRKRLMFYWKKGSKGKSSKKKKTSFVDAKSSISIAPQEEVNNEKESDKVDVHESMETSSSNITNSAIPNTNQLKPAIEVKTSRIKQHNMKTLKLDTSSKSKLKRKLPSKSVKSVSKKKSKQKDLLSYLTKITSPNGVNNDPKSNEANDSLESSKSGSAEIDDSKVRAEGLPTNDHLANSIDAVASGTAESLIKALELHNISAISEDLKSDKKKGKEKKMSNKKVIPKIEKEPTSSDLTMNPAKEEKVTIKSEQVKLSKECVKSEEATTEGESVIMVKEVTNTNLMKRSSSLDDYLKSTVDEKEEVGDEELALKFEELIQDLNSSLNDDSIISDEPEISIKMASEPAEAPTRKKKPTKKSRRKRKVFKKKTKPKMVNEQLLVKVEINENDANCSNEKIKVEVMETIEEALGRVEMEITEENWSQEQNNISNDDVDSYEQISVVKSEVITEEKSLQKCKKKLEDNKQDDHEKDKVEQQPQRRETRSSFKSEGKLSIVDDTIIVKQEEEEEEEDDDELPKRVTRQHLKKAEVNKSSVDKKEIESNEEVAAISQNVDSKIDKPKLQSKREIHPFDFYPKSPPTQISTEINELEVNEEEVTKTAKKYKNNKATKRFSVDENSSESFETIVAQILTTVIDKVVISNENYVDTNAEKSSDERIEEKINVEIDKLPSDEPKLKFNRPYGNKLLSGRLPSAGKAAALLHRKPIHLEPSSGDEVSRKRKNVCIGKKLSPARRFTRSNSNSKSEGKSDSVADPYDYNEDEIVPFHEPRYKPYSPPKPVLYNPLPAKRRMRKREDSPDTTTIVVQAEVHPEPPPKRVGDNVSDSSNKSSDLPNDIAAPTASDNVQSAKRKAHEQNVDIADKKRAKKSSDIEAEDIKGSSSTASSEGDGKATSFTNKEPTLTPKIPNLVMSPLRSISPSVRANTPTGTKSSRSSTPTRLPSPIPTSLRRMASPGRISSPERLNSSARLSSPVVPGGQSPHGVSPVVNSSSFSRNYVQPSKPLSPLSEPPQLIDESKVRVEEKLDPDVTSPLLQPAGIEPFSDTFDSEPPALEPTGDIPQNKSVQEELETEASVETEEDADSVKGVKLSKKKGKEGKMKKKKQLLRMKALRNKKKKELKKNPVPNPGKEVVKIAGISWEVSELSMSPPKKETTPKGELALQQPLPEPIRVKEDWESNELWDTPVQMLAPGPVRVQPSNLQLEPLPTQPSMPPIPTERPKLTESSSIGPISSLGSILDSVNKLLNEPETNFSQLPADYSLADLQRAMGASDDEMAVLQQLGEATSCLQEFDERSSASQSHCEDEWGPMIMDLDNQAAQQPIVSSSVELPVATPPQPEVPPASSPAPPPSICSSPALTGTSTSSLNSTVSKVIKEEPTNLLRGTNMCKRLRMVPRCSSTSLLDAHSNKEVVCPTCSSHFMGFQALQIHVNKVHGNSQHDPTQVTGQQNRRAAMESAKSSSRLVCFECQQILPSHLMYGHIEVEHSLEPSCIRKCSTVSGDPHEGPVGGERLKSKMSSALGDLLDKAVTNLLTSKSKPEGSGSGLTGSAMELLSRVCALRRRDSNRANSKDYSFNKLMMDIRLEDESNRAPPKLFPCSVCGQKFSLTSSRNKHEVLVHRSFRSHGDQPVVKEEFFDDDDWRDAPSPTEASTNEGGANTLTPTCSDCGLSFDSVSELMKHRVEDHAPRRRLSTTSEANTGAATPVTSSTAHGKAPRKISTSLRSQSLDQSTESGNSSTSTGKKTLTPSSSPPPKRASHSRSAKCSTGVKAKVVAALKQLNVPR